ncbi:hypothetical protein C8R45DRAFT_378741 [Mycena sanguinolenta]|nr:hypothetical protein C8R45DRAFT_378741 [Mycena sanguinolenta]
MTAHNRLLGLSDSALGYILQFLDDSQLYALSMTCAKLHRSALSMLLLRRGIPDPLDTVDIQLDAVSYGTLQVLRAALFVPTIRRLLLRFTPKIVTAGPLALSVAQLQATADCLLEEMRQMRKLFEKLDSIDEITLVLPGSLQWNLRDVNLERGETSDIFPWSQVIFFLQRAVRTHCRTFKIEDSPFNAPIRPPRAKKRRLPALLMKALKWKQAVDMSPLARRDGAKYRPHTGPTTDTSGSSTQHFYLRTTFLLFPSVAGWTFHVLRNSPIVSLHISGLSISSQDWDFIAPKLFRAVPDLRELYLDDSNIGPNCLMRMLGDLTRLTSLTIASRMVIYLRFPHLFPAFSNWFLPALPNLVKLSAPFAYVHFFLMRQNPLPALRQLELPPIDTDGGAQCRHDILYIHLPYIIRRLRSLNHSVCPLPVTFSIRRSSLAEHIDMTLALDPKIADNLREITHLVLSEGFDSGIDPQLLCCWLRLFPAVQHVSWNDPGPERVVTLPWFAREIFRACPTVQTILAQAVRYTSTEIVERPNDVLPVFVDLPTEVLIRIFDLLGEELLSLSILCRRFHFLALPLFLERNSIHDPCEMTRLHFGVMNSQEAVLRALTIALFVPSVKLLVCIFPAEYIHRRLDRIRQVTRLIRRLAMVDNLSLNFIPKWCRLDFVSDVYSKDRLWQMCFSALRDLLNAAASKSCSSLTIVGSPAVDAITPTVPLLPPPKIGPVTNLCLNVGCSATYSSWIFSPLRDNPVVSLKLTITGEKIDAPNFSTTLTTLSMDGSSYVSRSEVSKYLAKHPLLTTLTLGEKLSRYAANDAASLQPLRLNNLVALTASLSNMFYFLRDPPFPALERVTILLDGSLDLARGWALASLIERVRECYSSPPTIAVEVGDTRYLGSLSYSTAFMTSMGGKWTHAARHIVRLKLAMRFRFKGTDAVDAVVQTSLSWLRLFNGLHDLSIESLGRRHPPVDVLVEFGHLIAEALASVRITIQLDQRIVFER